MELIFTILKVKQKIDRNQETARRLGILKEERRVLIDARFKFIIDTLADATNQEYALVEDTLLGEEKFDYIENFFQADGRKLLMFYYQENKVYFFHYLLIN